MEIKAASAKIRLALLPIGRPYESRLAQNLKRLVYKFNNFLIY